MNEITTFPEREVTHTAPQPAGDQPQNLMALISSAVMSGNVTTDTVKALLDVQERVEARQAQADFNAALARASAAIPRVRKNGRVDLGTGKGGYAFATWEDMDTALRPVMQREGFTLSFDMQMKDGGGAVVSGTALHIGGHSKTVSVPLALDSGAGRNNLQAMGSTLSYGKRYCAEMLFNIVREGADDDGKAGGTVYITQADADALQRDAKAAEIPIDGFLDYMGVEAFEHIEVKDLAKARNAIKVSQAKKGKPQ